MTITIVLLLITLGIGAGSVYFYGRDNPIEKDAEEIIEDTLEFELHLPPNSLHQEIASTYSPPKEA